MSDDLPTDQLVVLADELRDLLGSGGWLDPADAPQLTVDYRGAYSGVPVLIARPDTVEDLRDVVRACAAAGVAVVTQGGHTSLSGGSVPTDYRPSVLLSTSRLNRIISVDPARFTITVEAGCTIEQVQQAAAAVDRHLGMDWGARGTATVGGAISTNAGGLNVLRYGPTRDSVLGLEAVLADGEVFDGLRALRKDNTGYDLKQLLIGAEGTLGVVTAAALKLFPVLPSRATAMVGLADPRAAIRLLARAKEAAGGGVEAFELISRVGVDFALKNIADQRDPLQTRHPWYVLVELASGEPGAAEAAMERLLGQALEEGLIADAAIAQSESQARAFWSLRENQSPAQKPEGATWKHDVSVPVSKVADFLESAGAAVRELVPDARICAFGHVGDGNIHYDVLRPEGGDDSAHSALRDNGSRRVHDIVASLGGSISAEHGLGAMKSAEALRYKAPVEVNALRAIRAALDPKRIMNPRVHF